MISVIVPVYNVEKYLENCIKSICKQTYKDIEIILVNDGSTDNSREILERYAEIDKRIKVITQDNQGLSAARNTGIEIASGEFIVFVDSDDMIHQQMIDILYHNLINKNADISICSYKYIDESEHIMDEKMYADLNINNLHIYSGRECILKMYSDIGSDMVVAWNKLYKTDILKNYRYPYGRIHEDEFLTYKILYPLNTCIFINLPLYYYRNRTGSITNQGMEKNIQDKVDALYERMFYFKHRQDDELYLQTLQRYATAFAQQIITTNNDVKRNEYKRVFKELYHNRIKTSKMPPIQKLKFLLFRTNTTLYLLLKSHIDNKKKNRDYK